MHFSSYALYTLVGAIYACAISVLMDTLRLYWEESKKNESEKYNDYEYLSSRYPFRMTLVGFHHVRRRLTDNPGSQSFSLNSHVPAITPPAAAGAVAGSPAQL